MIIKTRRDLPAMSWLQTRSKFWLTIAKHPLETGLQSLSWLEPYTLQQLKKTQRTKWMVRILGLTCCMGLGVYGMDLTQPPTSTLASQTVTTQNYLPLTPQPEFWVQSWNNGLHMWQMAETQLQLQQAKEHTQKQTAAQLALAENISTEYRIAPQAAQRVVHQAYKAADKQGVDPVLLLAVVGVESRFNPLAGSDAGAVGLVQALARAHPEKVQPVLASGASLTDVDVNLNLGAQILKEYLVLQKGNTPMALQQYKGSLKDPNQSYAHKVLAVKAKFDRVLEHRNA